MLFSIKAILLERAKIGVGLMITFTDRIFKRVWAWFLLFCFKFGWVNSKIHFVIPCEMSVMFTLVWTIILNVLQFLNLTSKNSMIPFPAVFALGGTRIHVCIMNGHNISSNIEAPVNQILSFLPTLGTLNICYGNH